MHLKDKLILGSAGGIQKDAVTLDIDPLLHPDIVHDMQIRPWPFKDDAFSDITAHHVLEHLTDLHTCMQELHRICKKDGTIYIEIPHHTSWCANVPAHKLRFNYFAFDIYIAENKTWMTGNKFMCIKKEITFHKFHRLLFLHRLFNKWPKTYERFFCYIFPAEHFKIWLRPVKPSS